MAARKAKSDTRPKGMMLWWADFFGDPRVQILTNEELGAYWRLLHRAWQQEPPCTLPDDDAVLCAWAEMSPLRWADAKPKILALFECKKRAEKYLQKRMKKEFDTARKRLETQKRAASLGGKRRWGVAGGYSGGTARGTAQGNAQSKADLKDLKDSNLLPSFLPSNSNRSNGADDAAAAASGRKEGRRKSAASGGGSGPELAGVWADVGDALAAIGVHYWRTIAGDLIAANVDPQRALALIAHARETGGYDAGAVVHRIQHDHPSWAVGAHWPLPKRASQDDPAAKAKAERLLREQRDSLAAEIIRKGRRAKKTEDQIRQELAAQGLDWPT